MKISAPILLHNEFIKDAKKNHYEQYSSLILQFLETHSEWGTAESATLFYEMLLQEETKVRHRPPSEHESGPPPSDDKKPHPVYNIGLTDQMGNVLIPFGTHETGTLVSQKLIRESDPINLEGKILAFAFPDTPPSLSGEDLFLLDRINNVINFGFYMSLIVALIFGFTLGSIMTKNLRKLRLAAESLKDGLNGQQIETIKTRDEIGILAKVLNEISLELEISHKQIKELAVTDELTNLYNRRFFNDELKILIPNTKRHNHNLSIALGDVDFFKRVNDNFSHQTGDLVLKQIADILKDGIREGDIVARYGGEEIIIALPETDTDAAYVTIERLRKSVESFSWPSIAPGLKITMSFGICSEQAPDNYEEMVSKADQSLYEAKKSGRNRTVCAVTD